MTTTPDPAKFDALADEAEARGRKGDALQYRTSARRLRLELAQKAEAKFAGHVVEFWRQPSSTSTGIIGNVPAERRIARVSNLSRDGLWLVATGTSGDNVRIRPEEITADLGKAQAGWGSW